MADVTEYTELITSEHSDKPKYMAMVQAVVQPVVDALNVTDSLPAEFDLDLAVGAQLDVVGQWVGIGRRVNTPLEGVYFSLDIEMLGFDQGVWKGPYDPDVGVTVLDDDSYRLVLKAKISSNHWDGTFGATKAIMDQIFGDATHVFIEDNQDMSMTVGVAGMRPPPIRLALLTEGYISVKPEGVRVKYYLTTTEDGPLFGFDINNVYIAGFDQGSWGAIYQEQL